MPKSDILVGLDVGTTKICAIVGEIDDHKVKVIGVGRSASTGLRKGIIVDLDATTQGIRDAVDKAQHMADVDAKSVIVGITGEHISSLNSRGVIAVTHEDREITEDDVSRALEAAKVVVMPPEREVIHNIPRGYSIDGQDGVKYPVGMSGTRLEVETHIVTGGVTFIQNLTKCVQRAGLGIEEIVLEPIATAQSVLQPDEKELGIAILDIGGGTSDLAIFSEGSIAYSSVIPVGGNHVTKDIAFGLQISLDEAERVKKEFGTANLESLKEGESFKVQGLAEDDQRELPRKVLAEIIEPRMEEIFQMVKQDIKRSGYEDLLPLGLVLSGGGSMLPGTLELARRVMPSRVRLGGPIGFGGLVDDVSTPIFATGIGLVQFGAANNFVSSTSSKPSRSGGSIFSKIGRTLFRWLGG